MSMGNLMGRRPLSSSVMATRERTAIGLSHPTVVPTNFEPEVDDDGTPDRSADGTAHSTGQ